MKPPKQLHIFGTTYTLKADSGLSERHLDAEIDKEKKVIDYDPTLKGKKFDAALLHEMFHAVFQECSLSQAVPTEFEEICVDTLANAVVKNFTLSSKK